MHKKYKTVFKKGLDEKKRMEEEYEVNDNNFSVVLKFTFSFKDFS